MLLLTLLGALFVLVGVAAAAVAADAALVFLMAQLFPLLLLLNSAVAGDETVIAGSDNDKECFCVSAATGVALAVVDAAADVGVVVYQYIFDQDKYPKSFFFLTQQRNLYFL